MIRLLTKITRASEFADPHKKGDTILKILILTRILYAWMALSKNLKTPFDALVATVMGARRIKAIGHL